MRREWLAQARTFAIDVVYPKRCASCRRRGTWVCDDCRAGVLPFARPFCARCGAPVGSVPCLCAELPPSIHCLRSFGPYEGWLSDAITAMKYEGEWARKDHLGETLAEVLAEVPPDALVAPVPAHRARLRERGYNQAAMLAHVAAALTGHAYGDVVQRTRDTAHQVGMGRAARLVNVLDAFDVRDPAAVHQRVVVLVDDVVTTGATLGACGDALLTAGAAEVWAVTLAR